MTLKTSTAHDPNKQQSVIYTLCGGVHEPDGFECRHMTLANYYLDIENVVSESGEEWLTVISLPSCAGMLWQN